MVDIRTQKQLYHLTDIENLGSILRQGILPRRYLNGFVDVADPAIVASRCGLQLENYVPFHFFAKNPFDGKVQNNHPQKNFVLLAVSRALAAAQNWKVIPTHPLATGQIQLLNYEDGMQAIDWELMNRRDYRHEPCRLTCMAECLSPYAVAPGSIFSINVRDSDSKQQVEQLKTAHGILCHVNITPHMFVGA
ncbi:DUF4433 domain-containing protein [Rheinheimera riviphila]|uniref:DUF4433 domain-containing protein n=2 Tax=Rheinheimera riviphila TaxID=1834037 RepID=A0A437QJA1_9GAMM|nr:DUF4433 domain-containing protein [Rheinheimera riviphila]